MPWISGAIAVGGSLLGASMQSDAAENAANLQAQSSQAAIDEQRRQFDTIQQNQAPWLAGGKVALRSLLSGMGLDPGDGSTPNGNFIKRFSLADFWNDPVTQAGYQSGLDLGQKALYNASPLTTGRDSGAALKELVKFGTDYTGQRAGDSYNRFVNDQGNQYNRTAGLAGMGQTATNQVNNAGMQTGMNISNLISGQGNAAAASQLAQGNAWGNGLTSISNWWNSKSMLDRMLGSRTGGYGGLSAGQVADGTISGWD